MSANSPLISQVKDRDQCNRPTHDLHVKGVPKNTWRRARQNAFDSDLSFKDFVIRVLDESKPYSSLPVEKRQP